jgi:hypothetical protein
MAPGPLSPVLDFGISAFFLKYLKSPRDLPECPAMAGGKEDLRALLDALGVSVADLAQRAELSKQAVYDLLAGARTPHKRTLPAIAGALLVSLDRVKAAYAVTWKNAGH